MKRCAGCTHINVETTVPIPLCRRCAQEFYAALMRTATRQRLICQGPSSQALEQEIATLAMTINQMPRTRPDPNRVQYVVNFVHREAKRMTKRSVQMQPIVIAMACLFSVFAASLAQAQAPQLTWVAPDNTVTSSEAQGLIYTLYVNGGTGAAVPGVTCAGSGPFTCTAPVPVGISTAIGTKLELTAKTATSEESPRSVPFSTPPSAPTSLRRR